MPLTEAEARTKWCPLAHTSATPDGVIYDTRQQSTGYTLCIASDCCFWRWYDRASTEPRRGYCGSAGKPDTP